jgi:hypothetical protein
MSGILKLGATGGQILFSTSGTAGFSGTAGYGSLYYGTDKQLRLKDDVGTITIIGAGGTNGTSGSSGTSGVDGSGLSTKNIEISAAAFTYSAPDSTASITFAQPFGSTNYSIELTWKNTNSGNWFSLSSGAGIAVKINNKTAAGFDIVYSGFNLPGTIPGYVAYITAIALGETAVPGTSGTSGNSGSSGSSGESGSSGSSGISGSSGTSGADGSSGSSGSSGQSGSSGSSGESGTSGSSGSSGANGTATINNNADNRVITGSNTPGELNGESTLSFNDDTLNVNGIFIGKGASGDASNLGIGVSYPIDTATTGLRNLGIHSSALNAITTGSDNSFIGFAAGPLITTGNTNTCFGNYTLYNATGADSNALIGYGILSDATGPNIEKNTVVGVSSLYNLPNGSRNTVLGADTANNLTGASNSNTIIGAQINTGGTAISNQVILGDGDGNIRLRITPNATGTAEFATSIKTPNPTGGTAAEWKLGSVSTAGCTIFDAAAFNDQVIEVEIAGTTYYIPVVIPNYC